MSSQPIAETEMITVHQREAIRRAYFIDNKSMRQIARELGHSRKTVLKAIASAEPTPYTLKTPRTAPRLGPYKDRIEALLKDNRRLPRKQRYTAKKIFEVIKTEGYQGSESTVRGYVAKLRQQTKRRDVFLPLEFDPGIDAQVDWGQAEVQINGLNRTVELFVMRLCYSRRLFVMAFPSQKQEAFFEGHVRAFAHFGGVPHRISYDNLKTAVLRILRGRNRHEQQAFVLFRSHYLFESRFCTPGQGHEKGRVEEGVGFSRRNFLVPPPQVTSFEQLNAYLIEQCLGDDTRQVSGQPCTIAEAFAQEKPYLRALPEHAFDPAVRRPVRLNGYSQVIFETNRYSVPCDEAYPNLVVKAYAFTVEILHQDRILARHRRSYEREQDVVDPMHYLPLLEQRPGAFEHAKPLRQWRAQWPAIYETLLEKLRQRWPDSQGIREFVRILKLHRKHPAPLIEEAVGQALGYGCVHADGVELCLRQLLKPAVEIAPLRFVEAPSWAGVGKQQPDLSQYNELLTQR